MLIATRQLFLRDRDADMPVVVKLFAPQAAESDWSCRYEIEWPKETWKGEAFGLDAMQAIELALKKIGADLYASKPHRSGMLRWTTPGQGYGFSLPHGLRDMLIGEDREL